MVSSAREPRPLRVVATVAYWQAHELGLLDGCVESLLGQARSDAVELHVILIDNGCGGTPAVSDDPRVEIIRLPENRGFAGGHNAAMRAALARGVDFILLFNSDAVADNGMLGELLSVAQSHPSAAFVGPLLLRANEPSRLESAGQAFNPWTGRHAELGRGELVSSVGNAVRQVDAVSGCAMLVRREAIERVGVLDADLFAYFEDMDWCLRARRAGYTIAVAPRARVVHIGQASTGSASALSTYYSVRNHLIVAARYGQAAPWLLMPLVVGYHLAFLLSSPRRRTVPHLRALVQGASAAWTFVLGTRRLVSAHRD